MLLIIGFAYHFCRIFVLLRRHNWLNLQAELDQLRLSYVHKHDHIMGVSFGRGHDVEMNFRKI